MNRNATLFHIPRSNGSDQVSMPVLIVCGFVGGIFVTMFLFCLLFFKLKLYKLRGGRKTAIPKQSEEPEQPKRRICYTRSNVSESQVNIGKWRAGYENKGKQDSDVKCVEITNDYASDRTSNDSTPGTADLLSSDEHKMLTKSATLVQTGSALDRMIDGGDPERLQISNRANNYDVIKEPSQQGNNAKRNLFFSAFHSIRSNISNIRGKKESTDDSAYVRVKSHSENSLLGYQGHNEEYIQTLPGNFRITGNGFLRVKGNTTKEDGRPNSLPYNSVSLRYYTIKCDSAENSSENCRAGNEKYASTNSTISQTIEEHDFSTKINNFNETNPVTDSDISTQTATLLLNRGNLRNSYPDGKIELEHEVSSCEASGRNNDVNKSAKEGEK